MLNKIYKLLLLGGRFNLYILLFFISCVALFEAIGVASIMPFIAVLSNPTIIQENKYLSFVGKHLKIINSDQFILVLGTTFFIIILISNVLKIITYKKLFRLAYTIESILGKNLCSNYIHNNFLKYKIKNSAHLINNILTETTDLTLKCIFPVFNLISSSIIFFLISLLLVLIDYQIAIVVAFSLIITYLLIYSAFKKKLFLYGKEMSDSMKYKFQTITEIFKTIKEIKIYNLNYFFENKYREYDSKYIENQIGLQVAKITPKYIVEASAFGIFILLVLALKETSQNFANIIPKITIYAFAAYKLIPAAQSVFTQIANLRSSTTVLNKLSEDLNHHYSFNSNHNCNQKNKIINRQRNFKKMNFSLELKNLSFGYPDHKKKIFDSFSISFPLNKVIGIKGHSGSGKTTLVNLITEILVPDSGKIFFNSEFRKNINLIGYVPQEVYILDDTIKANIAFGENNSQIDMDRVILAAKIANIHNYIINDLPFGYETFAGDSGSRLSGGQRQRLVIARAVYKNPKIIIFDEATSALDSETGSAVISEIFNLKKNFTVFLISHNVFHLKKCDLIFNLKNGKLISD